MTPKTEHRPHSTCRSVPIWLATLLGALVLSLFSIPQKIMINASFTDPKGFLVPVLFGGTVGFFIGILNRRLHGFYISQLDKQSAIHQELAASEERFRLLAENARDVIFRWLLLEHRYEYVSPAVFTLTGHTPEEFLANPRLLEELVIPDDRQVFEELNRQIARGDVAPHVEYRVTHKQGHIVWVNQRHAFGFNDKGQATSLEGICTDITEYRAARQEREDLESQLAQSQKMDAIGRLAGGIAHDFNNLLTVINGYSDLLLDDPQNQAEKPFELLEIQKAGRKATDLTAQLLTFSRKQIATPRLVDPAHTVRESLRMLTRMVGEDIRVELNISEDLPNIFIDSIQLDQVLLNLVVNAREAMPDGGSLLVDLYSKNISQQQCGLCKEKLAGQYVFLVISDTGCGMDQAIQNRIFDPFFTTKDVNQGTGMGLATVYGVVHQNKGHLSVESTPGKGSQFTILFPGVVDEIVDEPAPLTITSQQLRGSETILVVEDEPLVRSLTTTVLQQYGYTVLIAEDASEASEIFTVHRESIDLLLTDVVMPGISGVELSAGLLRQEPQLKVVFMSGYVDNKLNLTGISHSPHPFLKKPFGSEALTRIVRQTLDGSPA